jgi:ubiquinone/menaquinone biosynthesis C-methylase UbiE
MLVKEKITNIIKSVSSFVINFKEFRIAHSIKYAENADNTDKHIRLASDWLLMAQKMSPDHGYSRCYSIYNKKWDKSYIETTGYIIPSLFNVSEYFGESKYKQSAAHAADWLLKIQNKDGSFNDVDKDIPQVFDTGQCLIGLNFWYEKTGDKIFLEAAIKAADWLCEVQNTDGSWTRHSYNNEAHAYYTRVASALIKLYMINNNKKYYDFGIKNINWCINQQNTNGFFNYASFSKKEKPVLHTLIYIIEGLLEAYMHTNDSKILDSVLKNTDKFLDINLHRDIILYSRYDKDFNAIDKSRCVTGLSQWAGVCIDLYKITKKDTYLRLAKRTIYYLKSKQILASNKNLDGGFFGSIPYNANYGSCKLLNWNNKFFIDSLLKYKEFELDINDEHNEWTSSSFEFLQDNTVNNNITEHDLMYLKIIDPILEKLSSKKDNLKLLDLGCGKGKFIDYLKKRYKNIEFYGVDPVYHDNENLLFGTATKIPFKDYSFDVLLSIEVLQHVKHLDLALHEINRVLNSDGYIFIGERNKFSFLGLLKGFLERLNMWMYIADTPFTEKWYEKLEWKNSLEKNQFQLKLIKNINPIKSKIPGMNRYFGIVAKKYNRNI